MKLRYCIKCVQPDTRPNAKFNEHGVCPACAYLETIDTIDWEERKRELDEICEKYKYHRISQPYDCIIGVSGGKDSTRQALYVKEVCGLKPLLVSLSYPPGQSVERGAYNLSNLAELGFDLLMVQPAPERWRRLVRKAFFEFTNWCRSTELALFSSVPRVAQAYQIPLIFWGENPALQLGDQKTMGRNGWDGNNLRNMNTLSGAKNDWLLGDGVQRKHLLQYVYPSVEEMDRAGLQIVYLGYFWNIWSQLDNGDFSVLRGLDIRNEPIEDIGDPYGVSALDEDWVGMNQMIKYLKFGFGRVTDYANEEIRKGAMTREEGIEWVKLYDGCCGDHYIKSFCDYIGITWEEFWRQVDQSVNRSLFQKNTTGRWERTFEVE